MQFELSAVFELSMFEFSRFYFSDKIIAIFNTQNIEVSSFISLMFFL